MSANITSYRPHTAATALNPALYVPALIDGQVTIHALTEALAAAGLQLHRDAVTGNLVILAR